MKYQRICKRWITVWESSEVDVSNTQKRSADLQTVHRNIINNRPAAMLWRSYVRRFSDPGSDGSQEIRLSTRWFIKQKSEWNNDEKQRTRFMFVSLLLSFYRNQFWCFPFFIHTRRWCLFTFEHRRRVGCFRCSACDTHQLTCKVFREQEAEVQKTL